MSEETKITTMEVWKRQRSRLAIQDARRVERRRLKEQQEKRTQPNAQRMSNKRPTSVQILDGGCILLIGPWKPLNK